MRVGGSTGCLSGLFTTEPLLKLTRGHRLSMRPVRLAANAARGTTLIGPHRVVALRRAGIERLNFDLVYRRPHQTAAGVVRTVELLWASIRTGSRRSVMPMCPG